MDKQFGAKENRIGGMICLLGNRSRGQFQNLNLCILKLLNLKKNLQFSRKFSDIKS